MRSGNDRVQRQRWIQTIPWTEAYVLLRKNAPGKCADASLTPARICARITVE